MPGTPFHRLLSSLLFSGTMTNWYAQVALPFAEFRETDVENSE